MRPACCVPFVPAVEEPPVDRAELTVEAVNDRLALEHSIDDYYERSPWPIRLIERRRLSIISDFVGPSAGLEICEIGSGGGHVLRLFPDARLTAIDVSDVYLETARRNLTGYDVRFLKGEVEHLGLAAESFDRIVCTEVLEHTVDPDAILAEIARLLKPDGVAVVTVPNDPLIHRLKRWAAPILGRRDWGGDEYHLHTWRPREFGSLLERHLTINSFRGSPSRLLPIRSCFRCAVNPRNG
jgi:SAM-dependent methyltransferase